jgi:hypothetical protein
MAACRFQYSGRPYGLFEVALHDSLMEMVSTPNTCFAFNRTGSCGEDPLPPQFPIGIRILLRQRIRKHNPAPTVCHILSMQAPNELKMLAKRRPHGHGKHRHPVFPALAIPQANFAAFEIDVLDTKLERFSQPQPRTIK